MRERWSRRALLGVTIGGVAGLLGGCGFRPLYAPGGQSAAAGATREELASVQVALIPERSGQLLRRTLQHRLGSGYGVTPRYDLRAALQIGVEQEGFRRDGAATRSRYVVTAPWQLYTTAVPPVLVASGAETSADAWNLPDNQFFAADVASEAAQRRLIDLISSDIVEKVAIALASQAASRKA